MLERNIKEHYIGLCLGFHRGNTRGMGPRNEGRNDDGDSVSADGAFYEKQRARKSHIWMIFG